MIRSSLPATPKSNNKIPRRENEPLKSITRIPARKNWKHQNGSGDGTTRNKFHWTPPMKTPSSLSESQIDINLQMDDKRASPFTRNHKSVCSLGKMRELPAVTCGPLTSLQFRNPVPRSKWESYYKMQPVLVRRNGVEKCENTSSTRLPQLAWNPGEPDVNEQGDGVEKPAYNLQCQLNEGGDYSRVSEPELNSRTENRLVLPSLKPITKVRSNCSELRSSERNSGASTKLCTFPSQTVQQELMQRVHNILPHLNNHCKPDDTSYCLDGKEGKQKGKSGEELASEKAICDALILQKLLEIRNELENGTVCWHCGKGGTICCHGGGSVGVGQLVAESLQARPPHCYNGDVKIIERGQKDFLLENAIKCFRTPPKLPPKVVVDDWRGHTTPLPPRMVYKRDFGRIPKYIKKRKEEIQGEKEEQERLAAEELNRQCRAITDEERQTIVEGLSQHWEELFKEFQQLPLVSTAPRVLKRKGEIEALLRDLESDLKLISSHGRLFVSNESPTSQFLWK